MLTLFVVPAVYVIFDSLLERVRRPAGVRTVRSPRRRRSDRHTDDDRPGRGLGRSAHRFPARGHARAGDRARHAARPELCAGAGAGGQRGMGKESGDRDLRAAVDHPLPQRDEVFDRSVQHRHQPAAGRLGHRRRHGSIRALLRPEVRRPRPDCRGARSGAGDRAAAALPDGASDGSRLLRRAAQSGARPGGARAGAPRPKRD